MASPFTVFRRNQRAMMAFLCLVAMGAFVLVNPWNIGSDQSKTRSGRDVAVKTKFGDVREAELQNMVASRHGLARFLVELMVATMETQVRKEFKPSSTDAKQQELELVREIQQAQYLGQLRGQQLVQRFMRDGSGHPAEVEAMNTYILANKARELGMTISDDASKEFLRNLTSGVLRDADYYQIVQNLRRVTHLNEDLLFAALNNELLAYRLLSAVGYDARAELSTPAARLEYYSRLKQTAIVEAMALNVADFASQTPDPKDSDVTELFEKYKGQFAVPSSPEPGFAIPRKISFEYARIAMSPLIEAVKTQVSDKEIKDYYEAHRDLFRASELPVGRTDSNAASEPSDTALEISDDARRDESPESAPTSNEAPPSSEPVPSSNPQPVEDDSKKQSRRFRASPYQLARFADDTAENSAAPDGDAEAPADEQSASTSASQPDEAGAATTAKEAGTPAAEPPPTKPAASNAGPRYEPLEKVRDQIISQLARTKAGQARKELVENLREEMHGYSERMANYEAREDESTEPPPPRLNLADVAARQKGSEVQVVATEGLIGALEASRTEIGQSFHEDDRGRLVTPFVNFAYSDNLSEFDPRVSYADNGDTTFVYWKTARSAERIPELDEVRPQVVEAYKMLKARELAEAKAQQLAKEARDAKQSLREVFGGRPDNPYKVERIGPFSWMTTGTAGPGFESRLRRTELAEIPFAGDDFMRTVFGLAEGAVSVAFNEPKSVVYVLRPYSVDPPRETLQLDFARNRSRDLFSIAAAENEESLSSWFQSLGAEAKVEWQREIESLRRTAQQ